MVSYWAREVLTCGSLLEAARGGQGRSAPAVKTSHARYYGKSAGQERECPSRKSRREEEPQRSFCLTSNCHKKRQSETRGGPAPAPGRMAIRWITPVKSARQLAHADPRRGMSAYHLRRVGGYYGRTERLHATFAAAGRPSCPVRHGVGGARARAR